MKRFNVGIVGCGNISAIYQKNIVERFSKQLNLIACTDLIAERANNFAAKYPGIKAMAPEEFYANPDIEIVVNLTTPQSHFVVAKSALDNGKHVYSEKPLSLSRDDAALVLKTAKERGLRVANAPDTILGAGQQTCRNLIDSGAIGEPVSATAFMQGHGHESWHPDPEFYYLFGAGPMLDMGPYYVTALVNLLGPVSRVTGSARASFPTRTITSEKKNGKVIPVEVPTHIAGILDFANGAIGTIITSFDVWSHTLPCIEIHGSKGSLSVPDPNTFGGEVKIWTPEKREWTVVEHTHPYPENSRGIGVADMAAAIEAGIPHTATGELANHVLDVMFGIHDASAQGRHIELSSACPRPVPQPQKSRWG